MAQDGDYRATHNRAQEVWAADNPDYWRKYRATHPEYQDRNRLLQTERDARRREANLAKKDTLQGKEPIESGTYYLIRSDLAKMDASVQKVSIISGGWEQPPAFLQRRTRLPATAGSP